MDASSKYTVLARRFRPQSFDEVVGQEHVGQAIQNAIRTGRVAHAYLFTGARGVGKTSTARIFAKALNCPNAENGVPCNECDVCRAIGAGQDVDVLEIDGASNRGIDDIRQLRANVNVRSMRSAYKVYIIDEVHMLTKEAFNALLKTLEEPPPNVKFVFCTTEPNKIPDTILSRCQRFDFGTIAQNSIMARLRQIAVAEGKAVDDDAIDLVARRAAGSMRDSQSLFDQLLAFGGETITAADVHQLLGTASDDRLFALVDSLIGADAAQALRIVEESLTEGVQIGSFSDQLLNYLRDLLIAATGASEVPLSALAESSRPQLTEQAQRWGVVSITSAMQILAETKFKMQRASYARALVELALVRMASLEQLQELSDLVAQLSSGAVSTGSRPAAGSSELKKKFERLSPAPTTPLNSVEPETSDETPEPTQDFQSAPVTAETLPAFWGNLLQNLPAGMAQQLSKTSGTAICGPNALEILFPTNYRFNKTYCERPETRQRITAAARDLTGQTWEFRFRVDETAAPQTSRSERQAKREPERLRPTVLDKDAFVQEAVSIFGGQVVEVKTLLPEIIPEADDANETEGS